MHLSGRGWFTAPEESALSRSRVRLLLGFPVGLLIMLSLSSPALAIDEFPAAGSPSGLATGPDGNLWFTQETGNMIGRMTPGGVVTGLFPISTAEQPAVRDRGRS